jgi:hypothetical protein
MFLVALGKVFLWIALFYQLVDFGAIFIGNINCLPINLDGTGN